MSLLLLLNGADGVGTGDSTQELSEQARFRGRARLWWLVGLVGLGVLLRA